MLVGYLPYRVGDPLRLRHPFCLNNALDKENYCDNEYFTLRYKTQLVAIV